MFFYGSNWHFVFWFPSKLVNVTISIKNPFNWLVYCFLFNKFPFPSKQDVLLYTRFLIELLITSTGEHVAMKKKNVPNFDKMQDLYVQI